MMKNILKSCLYKKLNGGEKDGANRDRVKQRSAGLQREHLFWIIVTAVCVRGFGGNDRGYRVVYDARDTCQRNTQLVMFNLRLPLCCGRLF